MNTSITNYFFHQPTNFSKMETTPEYYVTAGESGSYTPAPEGTHRAVCSGIAILGTYDEEFQGVEKKQKKVRIFFELPDETREYDGKTEPTKISKEFSFSWSDKSNLYKFINNWRGKPYTPEELKQFNLPNIISAPCLLTIQHKIGKTSGKQYAEITSATPMVKGMEKPVATETFFYAVDRHDETTYAGLPEFVRNKIADSDEWKAMGSPAVNPALSNIPAGAGADDDSEPLPF